MLLQAGEAKWQCLDARERGKVANFWSALTLQPPQPVCPTGNPRVSALAGRDCRSHRVIEAVRRRGQAV